MNKDINLDDQDDVVVIEERDKNTLLYIILAAILGIGIGGLAGSIFTKNQWEPAYKVLEDKLIKQDELAAQNNAAIETKIVQIDDEVNRRVAIELSNAAEESEATLQQSQKAVIELEKVNQELEKQVQAQSDDIKEQQATIEQLERKVDMQSSIFARSRELFQLELLIKQELTRLEQEREAIQPQLQQVQKECDVYLKGTSFDVNSSSCDRQDEYNATLSQIDQMIEVNRLDLEEIASISDSIGL